MKHLSFFEKNLTFPGILRAENLLDYVFCAIFLFSCINFFCPSPFDLFVLTSFIKEIAYARQVYILYLEIRTLLYRSRYLEEDEKKHLFEKVRKNLVVSKLKITRSSISPMGERGYLMFFKSHRIFLPFVLDSLIEHEILVKFAFVIQYTQRKKPLHFREIQWGI